MAVRHATPPPKPRCPVGPQAWANLLRQVIARAEATQDPRLEGLRKLLGKPQIEAHLRRMGILGPNDIQREFPGPRS